MINNLDSTNAKRPIDFSWIIQTGIIIGLVLSISFKNALLMNICVIVSMGFCFIFSYSDSFLLLISLSIFENTFSLFGNKAFAFVLVSIIVKWLITHRSRGIKVLALPFIWTVLVSTMNDYTYMGLNGFTISTFILLLYVFILYSGLVSIEIDPVRFMIYFGTAYLIMILYLLGQYGGLSGFINMFLSASWAIRFGHEYANEVGGAMAIPIYSLLLISFSIVIIIMKLHRSIIEMLYVITIGIIAAFFGALTVSRSFYFGIAAAIVVVFISNKTKTSKDLRDKVILLLFLFVGLYLVYHYMPDVTNKLLENITQRIRNDTSGGTGSRAQIYSSCFEYLSKHPLAILFGRGSEGYQELGNVHNYLFSAGCHNYYLDIVMSFGLFGCVSILLLVLSNLNMVQLKNNLHDTAIIVLPLMVLSVFAFTALRTNSIKPHIYFYLCIYCIVECGNWNRRDDIV